MAVTLNDSYPDFRTFSEDVSHVSDVFLNDFVSNFVDETALRNFVCITKYKSFGSKDLLPCRDEEKGEKKQEENAKTLSCDGTSSNNKGNLSPDDWVKLDVAQISTRAQQFRNVWTRLSAAGNYMAVNRALCDMIDVLTGHVECIKHIEEYSDSQLVWFPNGNKTTVFHRYILENILKKNFSNFAIQKNGFLLMSVILDSCDQNFLKMVKGCDLARHIIKVLAAVAKQTDPEVHIAALKLIVCLAKDKDTKAFLLIDDSRLITTVMKTMKDNEKSAEIQALSCHLLQMVTTEYLNDQGKKALSKNMDLEHIIDSLVLHSTHSEMVCKSCQLLRLAMTQVDRSSILELLVEKDVHRVIVKCLQQFKLDTDTFTACLGLLDTLLHIESIKASVVKCKVPGLLYSALSQKENYQNSELQTYGLNICQQIAPCIYKGSSQDSQDDWLAVIMQALLNNPANPAVQASGCRCICALIEHQPHITDKIGEDSLEYYGPTSSPRKDVPNMREPLHSRCIFALLTHGKKHADVFSASCDAIYWLSANNERLRSLFTERGTHEYVLECMKKHGNDAIAQSSACRVIRGFCIFCLQNKETMIRAGAHEDRDVTTQVIRVLNRFNNDLHTQIEAIATIACLADVDTVRNVCIVKNVHKKILFAMKCHITSELLIEVALEALANIVGSVGGPSFMNENKAMDRVVQSMQLHPNSSLIQKKGLVLLQLLPMKGLTISLRLAENIVNVTISAMKKYEDVDSILMEGCVAIQLIVDSSPVITESKSKPKSNKKVPSICELFVQNEIHLCLFNILEQIGHSQLQEAASDCLCLLSCEKNLKSEMLLTACNSTMHQSIQCLIELGADVNIGVDKETPLCIAVEKQDNRLVKYLLSQNVNSRHLQTALDLAKTHGCNYITGLLLEEKCYEQRSGTLMWCGHDLKKLEPEVFYSAFGVDSQPLEVDMGQILANKIKKSSQRRKRRKSRYSDRESVRLPLRYENSVMSPTFSTSVSEDQTEGSFPASGELLTEHVRRPSIIRKIFYKDNSSKDDNFPLKIESSTDRPSDRRTSLQVGTTNNLIEQAVGKLSPSSSMPQLNGDDNKTREPETPGTPTRNWSFSSDQPEVDEYFCYTYSGANVPFHPLDPRAKECRTSPVKVTASPVNDWSRMSLTPVNLTPTGNRYSIPSFPTQIEVNPIRKMATFSCGRTRPIIELRRKSRGLSINFEDSMEDNIDCGGDDEDLFVSDIRRSSPPKLLRPMHRSSSVGNYQEMTRKDIKSLVLSDNNISSLLTLVNAGPPLLSAFNCLEKLNLSYNKLTTFNDELLKYLPNIEKLDLKNNLLKKFPSKVVNCKRLSILDLSENQIDDVTEPIESSFSLRELNLSRNYLESFPVWINLFHGLEMLNLSHNKISALPSEPLALKKLKTLDLKQTGIKRVPEHFLMEAVSLEIFIASCNEIYSLPSEEVARKLIKLSTVKLDHNDLSGDKPDFIPKFILALKSLRIIDLRNNNISGFPNPKQWQTPTLRELILSYNNIDKIDLGEEPGRWSELERLILRGNHIKEIPKEIGELVNLCAFDVSRNTQIRTLPDQMGRLSRLWDFPKDGLNLDLPPAIIKGNTKALITFLLNKLKNAVSHYRMKMMVVGYVARGKSTIVRQLMKTPHPPLSQSTNGIEVKDWVLDSGEKDKSGQIKYTLSIWDFAGQEEFYSTHQCFLSSRSLYLVVYDLSRGVDEINQLKLWLLNIHAHAPGCPVILVGTHQDLLPREDQERIVAEFRLKIDEMCSKPGFPKIEGKIEVNCTRESNNIVKLRDKIKFVIKEFRINRQPVMGMKIPASYLKLEELITAEKKHVAFPVLTTSRVEEIARSADLDLNIEELFEAVRFLHDTGVLLHYDDTSSLKDLYFIDPQWLCRMMAQVVTVEQVQNFITSHGILHKKHCPLMFTGSTIHANGRRFSFPPDYIEQYLRLLEKFEIALPLNSEEWLIPCRLPLTRPEEISQTLHKIEEEEPDLRQVKRIYVLPYTPLGFWSRLITRLLTLVNTMFTKLKDPDMKFWREGILVYWSPDVFFLIDAIHKENENIQITVPNKRKGIRLLGHLVDHVDTLIEEWYPGLLVKDPSGEELVQRLAPCHCQSQPDRKAHMFQLDLLINESEHRDDVTCPEHKTSVKLSTLAPDIVLADLENRYHITKEDSFKFIKSAGNLLGEGGFGDVYQARLRGESVAVKVFNIIGDVHPHALMRQEVTIMRQLYHLSLLSMKKIQLRPNRLIVLELAREGSLGSRLMDDTSWLSRPLIHRIAVQVAEGMSYLHRNHIIYRDMKPDNILLFSLSLQCEVNAKIADYGIARFAQHKGLKASEGTAGYKSPENIKGQPYSFVSDVFSYGVTVYEMVTGLHPFHYLTFRSERDEAIKRNMTRPSFIEKGSEQWPDMQDFINYCLEYNAEDRPTADQVLEKVSRIDLLAQKNSHFVCQNMTIECVTVRGHGDGKEVWIGSAIGKLDTQLSWLSGPDKKIEGTVIKDCHILCMLAVDQSTVLIGSLSGEISVFDGWKRKEKFKLPKLQDAVVTMCYYKGPHGVDLILAGLANGHLAMYRKESAITDSEAKAHVIQIGGENNSIKCITTRGSKVFASCGSDLVLLRPSDVWLEVEQLWKAPAYGMADSRINKLIAAKNQAILYISRHDSCIIEVFDFERTKVVKTLHLSDMIRLYSDENDDLVATDPQIKRVKFKNDKSPSPRTSGIQINVTSMLLPKTGVLWIGTRSGLILIVDVHSDSLVTVIRRHRSNIRSLTSYSSDDYKVVLSGGRGSIPLCHCSGNEDDNHGYLHIWDMNTDVYVKNQETYKAQRKALTFSDTI